MRQHQPLSPLQLCMSIAICYQDVKPLLVNFGSMATVEAIRFSDDEAWQRTYAIERHGQPVRLRVEWSGHLLMVVCEPLDGFVHLVQNVEQCVQAFGEYHISLSQWPVATTDDYEYLHRRWHEVTTVIPISHVSGAACLEIGDCFLAAECKQVHNRPEAWYADRPLHISA